MTNLNANVRRIRELLNARLDELQIVPAGRLLLVVCLFVMVEALRPSQQFFSHAGTAPLPGYCQYLLGGNCILLKDTTWRPEGGPLAPESDSLPLGHRASLLSVLSFKPMRMSANLGLKTRKITEPMHDKPNVLGLASSDDSDQPGHPHQNLHRPH